MIKTKNNKSAEKIKKGGLIQAGFFVFLITAILIFALFSVTKSIQAENHNLDVESLRKDLDERGREISKLQEEIKKYEEQLTKINREARTLETAVQEHELSAKKFAADIHLTERKMEAANLEIKRVGLEIAEGQNKIEKNQKAIAEIIVKLHEKGSYSLVESLLSHNNLFDFWAEIDSYEKLSSAMTIKISELETVRRTLEKSKEVQEGTKVELASLNQELSNRKRIAEASAQEQESLLRETRNIEANYKALLEERKNMRMQFEADLLEIESQIRRAIDPTSVPEPRSGVLAWPLDNIRITQGFGYTDWARQNRQAYGGSGWHNGIDLAAPVGTPVRSAADGKIVDFGDTDLTCPNASWGKWMLVEHANGLSTLYAHLSVIGAKKGQNVSRGEIIGYTGNTGFSTGPHLHFTVYATQGVEVTTFPSRGCPGRTYRAPVADMRAYFDPLSFL